jgi:hypothetical protein
MVAVRKDYAAPTGLMSLAHRMGEGGRRPGEGFSFGFGSTNMPRLTALGISVRVFRVVRGQMRTAKYANHANKISLGNGFRRDAGNGNRDGRAPQQCPSRAANGSLRWTNGV